MQREVGSERPERLLDARVWRHLPRVRGGAMSPWFIIGWGIIAVVAIVIGAFVLFLMWAIYAVLVQGPRDIAKWRRELPDSSSWDGNQFGRKLFASVERWSDTDKDLWVFICHGVRHGPMGADRVEVMLANASCRRVR